MQPLMFVPAVQSEASFHQCTHILNASLLWLFPETQAELV